MFAFSRDDGFQGAPKTEASAKDVPLDAASGRISAEAEAGWSYNRETDWVFASPTMKANNRFWPETYGDDTGDRQ